jgi:site-specific recombinase XerD
MREAERALQEHDKEIRKQARAQRERQQPRDAAFLKEYLLAIQNIHNTQCPPFTKARDIVCLTLLYLTGMRISNLLFIQVRHLQQLLDQHLFTLSLIKKKKPTLHTFVVPPVAVRFLEDNQPFFLELMRGKPADAFVITQEDNGVPVRRQYLNDRINHLLLPVGISLGKNLRSHSFRYGFITSLLNVVDIHKASKIVGHADIRTTQIYDRTPMSILDNARAINKALKREITALKEQEQRRKLKAARALLKIQKDNALLQDSYKRFPKKDLS